MDRRRAASRRADPPRPVRPRVAGAVRARGGPHPGGARRPRSPARARRLDVRARPVRQARHRHRPRRPRQRATRTPTSRTWIAAGYAAARSASPTGSSTACSRARTRTSTCTRSPRARPRSERMLAFRDRLRSHPEERAESTWPPSGRWPAAPGRSSRTTPTRRAAVVEGIIARAIAEDDVGLRLARGSPPRARPEVVTGSARLAAPRRAARCRRDPAATARALPLGVERHDEAVVIGRQLGTGSRRSRSGT